MEIYYKKIIAKNNLELAWRRITTGFNIPYKKYFRELYYSYEIALSENLKDLHSRLAGKSYSPSFPIRIYLPKPSGLQRPISLLLIEDQILLQAIANVFAEKLHNRRENLQLKTVFSNILQAEKSNIFFFQDWHYTYYKFQEKIEEYYNSGLKWIAHFDLAAFYDTISHDLLTKILSPKNGSHETRDEIKKWLKTWSCESKIFTYDHGIPQGPDASNFLAECFLLPIDEVLGSEFKYIRYVDDIRLFADNEPEVQKAALKLEVLCRERGLIPQGKKNAIKKALSLEDAMGSLPSMAPPDEEYKDRIFIFNAQEAVKEFKKVIHGKPQKISDKTRAKYILYHSESSDVLLKYVIRLIPRHPEHIDAFVFYLSHYNYSKKIINSCKKLLLSSPYEYVQGEMWHILANTMKPYQMYELLSNALKIIRNKKINFSNKFGAFHFLCVADENNLGKYCNYVKSIKYSLLQAFIVPYLSERCFIKDGVVKELLLRTSCEPGIMLTKRLIANKKRLSDIGIKINSLPSQVKNVYRESGIIIYRYTVADPISEIISKRYSLKLWKGWKKILGSEYGLARQLLSIADPVFDSGRSQWLAHQNSFNHILFLQIQKLLKSKSKLGIINTTDRYQKPLNFGVMLDSKNAFSINYFKISEAFREVNERRNRIPSSHPYDIKSGNKTENLKRQERDNLHKKLKEAYLEIIIKFN